jgi:hypothetical protein
MLDAVTVPLSALRRLAHPGILVWLALLISASTVLIALPGADGVARQVTGVAAAALTLGAGLWAGFGAARRRR